MNSKKAKLFRKMAKSLASNSQISLHSSLIEDEKTRKYNYSIKKDLNDKPILDSDGKPMFDVQLLAEGQMKNNPNSVRGIYRSIKKDDAKSNV